MKRIINILFLLLAVSTCCMGKNVPPKAEEYRLSPSTYNYTRLSNQITAGASTKYDKAKRIYEWMIDNFNYDYTYTIRTGDKAMARKIGVCQALTEVFYHLAKAQHIDVRIVTGVTTISTDGHTWIMFTSDDGRKVLADPTWAISSKHPTTRRLFFDMPPRFAILSHYPAFAEDQLLQMPILYEDFCEYKKLQIDKHLDMFCYGVNEKIYERIGRKKYDFPLFYSDQFSNVQFIDVPLEKELTLGNEYRLRAKLIDKDAKLGVYHENGNVYHSVKTLADGTVEVSFKVLNSKPVVIAVEEGTKINYAVEYQVKAATKDEIAKLEKDNPYFSECLSSKVGIDTLALKRHGISGEKLLEMCKQGKLGMQLPVFQEQDKPEYTICSIPMDVVLKKGTPYTFHIFAPTNRPMIVQESNGRQYDSWIALKDGSCSITITPSSRGTLYIFQKNKNGGYSSCLCYEVK